MKSVSKLAALSVCVGMILGIVGLPGLAGISRPAVEQGYAGDECVTGPANPYSGPVEYETVNLPSVLNAVGLGQPVTLPFYQRTYQLQLTVWDELVAPGATLEYVGDSGPLSSPLAPMVYKGNVVGSPSNQVVFGITLDWIGGFVVDTDGIYFLEMSRDSVSPTPYMSFRMDLAQYLGCGTGSGEPGPGPLDHTPPQTILLYADLEYRNLFWYCPFFGISRETCAANQMLTDFATTTSLFNLYTTVDLVVAQALIHTPAHFGGLTSFDAGTLNVQLRNDAVAHVQTGAGGIFSPNFHITHLFSGKNFNGNTIGQSSGIPGHFSVSQHVPETWIGYFADAYHRTVAVISHEVGHDYASFHEQFSISSACTIFFGFTIMAMWRFQPRACAFSVAEAGTIHAQAAIQTLCVVAPPCTG